MSADDEAASGDDAGRWVTTVIDGGHRERYTIAHRDAAHEVVWKVCRDDSPGLARFSAHRPTTTSPPPEVVEAFTVDAVHRLVAGAGVPDPTGWFGRTLAAILLFASVEVLDWSDQEWAVDTDRHGTPLAWATGDDARAPFDWLRATTTGGSVVVSTYQEDAHFGLSLERARCDPQLTEPAGSHRPRTELPLVTGPIRRVTAVLDTTIEGLVDPALLTEVLIESDTAATLLIAAEAYAHDEWHLHDESVVALTDPRAAEGLSWVPARSTWPLPSPLWHERARS